jgi:hypothetical protein
MKVKIITPVRALPKIVPIIQAKQISRVLLVIAWAPSLKIKSVIHRTILYFLATFLRGAGVGFGFPAFKALSMAMFANITGRRSSAAISRK